MLGEVKRMECNRRNFLRTAATMGGVAALGSTASLIPATAMADEAASGSADPVVTELAVPGDAAAPDTTSYECDVLVVGGGWAGLHAAVTAKKAGANVVLADKGLPGYSGLAPFAAGCTYYDPDWDEYEGTLQAVTQTGEYIANIDNFAHDMDNSRAAYDENVEFGIIGGYLNAPASGYTEYEDDKAYFQANIGNERHHKWMEVLDANEIPVADHVMIVDILTTDDGSVCGAVGLHFQSSTVVTFSAKAVVFCTGGGSYKPAGYVTSGDTFDGEYIAVQHGLTIVGKEFDDFHQTCSYQPGDYYYNNTWDYVEPYAPYASFSVADDADARNTYASGKASYMSINRINQALEGLAPSGDALTGSWRTMASHGVEKEDDDPRAVFSAEFGEGGSNRKSDTYGAAPGMQTHMNCGIYCGWDDHDGATPLPGLYCAGDGIYGDMSEGCMYCFIGTTTTHCSVQGNMAGAAAAAYAAGVERAELPQDQIDAVTDEIFAPTKLEKGFDPNYVVNQLQATMIAPQIQLARDATSLNAALAQVEYLRDNIVPKMMGYTGHDLRICLEAKHKVLSAEMKLRATLFREESRGMHYRSDFPYRDDENFLCHIGVSKAEDGSIQCEKIEIPDSWKGDTSLPYTERYVWRFPGEAAALGIADEGMYEDQG